MGKRAPTRNQVKFSGNVDIMKLPSIHTHLNKGFACRPSFLAYHLRKMTEVEFKTVC
jgi:hypothetical protein